jgi:hypothetical protein
MTINASNKLIITALSSDDKRHTKFPAGNYIRGDYAVYPKLSGGIFDNDTIPNLEARWRILSANSIDRWEFYDGGGYTFNSNGASAGVYVATYEVLDWDTNGNNANSTISVTAT